MTDLTHDGQRETTVDMKHSRSLVVGVSICAVMVALALTSALWTPHDPLQIDAEATFAGPSVEHPFGTDQLGRDVLSTIWQGARTSLLAAVLAAALAMLIGATAGVVAATSRRWANDVIITVSTVFVAFPALLLGLLVAAARGPSTSSSVLTIAIATGASVAVVTRSDAADIMRQHFVTAARYCGGSTWSIIKRHVIRNLLASIIVQATGAAAVAVVAESTLSYLGLGAVPPTPSWGRMLASTQQYLLVHPLLTLWPALFISVTVLGISLLGDGLRERLDPSLRAQL